MRGNNLLIDFWSREEIEVTEELAVELRLNMLYTGLALKGIAVIALILTSNSQHELVQTAVANTLKLLAGVGRLLRRILWLAGVALYIGTGGMLCMDRFMCGSGVARSLGLPWAAPAREDADDLHSDDGDADGPPPSPPHTPPLPRIPIDEDLPEVEASQDKDLLDEVVLDVATGNKYT